MDIRAIISKLNEIEESPAAGDVVYLEFGDILEVETTILEVTGEGMVLEADDKLVGLLEDLNRIEESGLQYYTGKKKYGKEGMAALAAAGRGGASQEELGRIKDRYLKKDESTVDEGDVIPFKRPGLRGDAQNLQAAKELAKELYWREASSYNTPAELAAEKDLRNRLAKMGYEAESDLDADDFNMVITHKVSGKQYRMGEDELLADHISEAEYQGRNVPLGKPMRGDVKKFKVYVRDPSTGNVKKVNFGDKKMRIKKSNPARRKSFRARHNCANPGPRTKARYWSCRKW